MLKGPRSRATPLPALYIWYTLTQALPLVLLIHTNTNAEDDFLDMDEFKDVRKHLFKHVGYLSSLRYHVYSSFQPLRQHTDVLPLVIQSLYEEVIYGYAVARSSYHDHLRERLHQVRENKGLSVADGVR